VVFVKFLVRQVFKRYNNKYNKKQYDVKKQQLTLLIKLLEFNQNTSFGKFYSFKEMIKNPKYYQTKVPIHRYEDLYQDWWSRTHLKDEQHIFWNEPIRYFALSSGTSEGATKYLPVSKSAISSMSKITMRMISQIHEIINHSSELTSQVLWLGGSSNLNEDNGIFTGDISGINAKFRPSYLNKVFKPEKDISNILSWEKRL